MDEQREAAVWKRVTAGPDHSALESSGSLLRTAGELAAAYQRLSSRLTGRSRILAQELLAEERSVEAALRGIAVLSGQSGEQVKLWAPEIKNSRKLLEHCYHKTLLCHREFTARSLDPEFGGIFRLLSEQEIRQCLRIAQLLGQPG